MRLTVCPLVTRAVSSGQNAWALKSKAALLVALLIKRQGAPLLDVALPELALLSQQGAPQAEAVQNQPIRIHLPSQRLLPYIDSIESMAMNRVLRIHDLCEAGGPATR